jgi:hypothetical protein
MNTTAITAKKILNAWFSEKNARGARRAKAKRLKNSCLPPPFTARAGMEKPSRLPPVRRLVPVVPQPVAKAAATDEQNH